MIDLELYSNFKDVFKGSKSMTVTFNEMEENINKESKEKMQDMFCYSYFNQKKDPNNPRGYSQVSIVLVSQLKLIKIFNVSFIYNKNVFGL